MTMQWVYWNGKKLIKLIVECWDVCVGGGIVILLLLLAGVWLRGD
jgi:hypothetical protein